MKKINKFLKKYGILFLIFIVYTLFCSYVYEVDIKDREIMLNDSGVSAALGEIKNSTQLEQSLKLYTKDVVGIVLYPATYGNDSAGDGIMTVNVQDGENNSIEKHEISLNTIKDNNRFVLKLNDVIYRKEYNKININITFHNMKSSDKLTLYVGNGESENVYVNGNREAYSLKIGMISNSLDYFSVACLVSAILIAVLIFIIYYLLFIKANIKVNILFIPIAIILGVIYFTFIPEYETPDELRHMETAYYISNQVLGESKDGNVYMRESDYNHIYGNEDDNNTFFHKAFNREYYNNYYYNLIYDRYVSNELIDVGHKPLNAKLYLYIFSGMGILLGRLLGLSSITTFLLGAFLNYIFAVIGIYYAITKIPIFKKTFLLISILPITLQQISSFSYDCMIIVISFVFIALCIRGLHDKLNIVDMGILLLTSIMLIQVKSGAYAPIILLLFVVSITNRNKNRNFSRICIGIFIISVCALMVNYILNVAVISNLSSNKELMWSDEQSYSLGYLFDNTDKWGIIFWSTLIKMGSDYFYTTFGGGLGWFSMYIPWAVIIVLFMTILITSFSESDCDYIKKWMKNTMLMISILCIGLICGALLLDWTPITSNVILGVQGRYFLPILPLLFMGFNTNKIKIDSDVADKAILTTVIMQSFVLQTMIANS